MPDRALSKVLAENVKAIRKHHKKTQPEVTQTAGRRGFLLSQATISRVERGALDVSISVLQAIAAGLETHPWQLLVPGLDPSNLPALKAATEAERLLWERLKTAAKQAGIT